MGRVTFSYCYIWIAAIPYISGYFTRTRRVKRRGSPAFSTEQ